MLEQILGEARLTIRFLHTADWQIGKSFGQIPGDAGVALRRQRLATVRRLAELARAEKLDAVLVAGDVFDSSEVSDETIHRCLNAMEPFSGPWVLLPGNHDPALAAGVWSRLNRLGRPDNVIIAGEATPILLQSRLAVLPAPLMRRHESLDLTAWFDRAETPASAVRVGLAHGSVMNRLPSASEAHNQIADDRAARARLDYLALGDWHGTLEIAPRTWYSGAPEPDRHRNNDAGNVLLVSIAGPGQTPAIERRAIGHYRWMALEVALADGNPIQAVTDRLDALNAELDRGVVAISLVGSCTLAERHALALELERRAARFLHLDIDDTLLFSEPSDDELDAIDTGGFVRNAIEQLREMMRGADLARAATARAALLRLYREHRRLAG